MFIDPATAWATGREVLAAQGYTVPLEPSTSWQRIPSPGKGPRNRSTAVRLAPDGTAVHLVDHATGYRTTVQAGATDALDPADAIRARAAARRARAARDADTARRHHEGRTSARQAFDAATPLVRHPYPDGKGVAMPGCRVTAAGVLLVPLTLPDGALESVERIDATGGKRSWPGAPRAGAAYRIGTPTDDAPVLVCEGAATGAALHAATGHAVACAMDCGNLVRVATALRERHPRADIVVCGDDDRRTSGNPGRTKATEAARPARARLTFPPFCRPDCSCSDFDDTLRCERTRGAA